MSADILFASDRTCCVCEERGKAIQIHHIDDDPSNNATGNLAVLCLEHHHQTQLSGGFGRHLTAPTVLKFRDAWLERVRQRRAMADRLNAQRMAGYSQTAVVSEEAEPYSTTPPEAVREYIEALPNLREALLMRARPQWNTGTTSNMLQGSYEYIDALEAVLVALGRFYAPGSFGTDIRRYISEIIASRFTWHRSHSEPDGPGTGGAIVNVICSGNVMKDVETMVEDMVRSLMLENAEFVWADWDTRWRQAI